MTSPWLLARDFNDIAYSHGKLGGAAVFVSRCNKFHKHIDQCGLLNMGVLGPKFTWRGPMFRGGHHIYERLDRGICNDKWNLLCPDGYVRVLPRLAFSDHHPLLINSYGNSANIHKSCFGFEGAWLTEKDYPRMLDLTWDRSIAMEDNLKRFQDGVMQWKFNNLNQVMH